MISDKSWYKMLLILITGIFLQSCNDNISENVEPGDLTLEITEADDGSGFVIIEATAINTIDYKLLIDSGNEAEYSDSRGYFEHTFTKTGIYQVEVRAYGSSGRYVSERRQLEVRVGDGITPEDGYNSPIAYEGYNLVWNDEFDGNSVKPDNWSFEIGTGCPNCGWGNNELQYYRRENAWVDGGVLTIEARKEAYQGSNYTSARMITQDLKSYQYGRIDVRALLPEGQGIWPAIWMLGNSIKTNGWPECGEIDIMELIGGEGRDNVSHGTIHWEKEGEHVHKGDEYSLSQGTFADEYHVFTILWDESTIRWLVNDNEFYVSQISSEDMSEFHQKYFFILNVAVGGNWPGNPDSTTRFPQRMKVDYIRVFQKE